MKRLLILLILFLSSCQHNNNVKSLIDLVPTDPVLIIKNRTDLNNNLINFNNGLNQILVKNLDSISDYDSKTLTSYHVIGKNEIKPITFRYFIAGYYENKNIIYRIG